MFAVAIFATGAAAFGPVYLHSADQLVLNGTLGSAPVARTGLTISPASAHRPISALAAVARQVPQPGAPARWWGHPILTQRAGFLTVPSPPGRTAQPPTGPDRSLPYGPTHPFAGTLVTRSGACAHLEVVAGRCASGTAVVISTRTASLLGLRVGDRLRVRFPNASEPVGLLISGLYRPSHPDAAYWWGQNYFAFGSLGPGLVALVELDAVFTSPGGIRSAAPSRDVAAAVQIPYHRGSLTVDALPSFEERLSSFQSQALRNDDVHVHTGLWGLFAGGGAVEHTSATVVDIADLELGLLGIFVLYFVASRTAAEREPDVRLAGLRGFGMRSTVAVALAEPLAIVAVAVPLGLLGAWLVAGAASPAVFGPGIPVALTPLAVGAAVAAGLAGVAAAALGTRGSLVATPIAGAGGQLSTPRRASRWSVFADVAVVAVAGAAVFQLAVAGDTGGRGGSDPLAALAPALLAAALGVVVSRFVPRILATTHLRTAFSNLVSTALATRIVARRREYAAQIVLSALAVALVTFAICGWVIAGRNRDLRAELAVGAPRVLTVSVSPGTTFMRAVRASDPRGHGAMAVVVEHARDGTTLALDARNLSDVAMWPTDLGMRATDAAHRLVESPSAPQVLLRGSEVAAVVDVAANTADPPPVLRLDLLDLDSDLPTEVTLGPLRAGTHRYVGALPGACPGGCRLTAFSVAWSPPRGGAEARLPVVDLTVRSLAERRAARWSIVPAGLSDVARWTNSANVRLSSGRDALAAQLRLNEFGAPLTFGPDDTPKALPVLVTPTSTSIASGFGGPLVVGLDGDTLSGHTVGEVPSLPGVGPRAVLADLGTMERFLHAPFKTATTQVWLSARAPAGIVARLQAHGIQVAGIDTASAAVSRLGHSGLNLAYLLYLVAAVAAGLLAVATTAFALSSGARRRQSELAALRAVGVAPRSLARAVLTEQALVLFTGTVVGVLAGAVGAVIALRSVPEFVARSPGPPLELALPSVALVLTVGAVVIALAAVVAVGTSLVVRGSTVDRLAGG
jgi:putative ABC transport system permease protein